MDKRQGVLVGLESLRDANPSAPLTQHLVEEVVQVLDLEQSKRLDRLFAMQSAEAIGLSVSLCSAAT